jgi:serine/threonine protein kinase
VHAVLFSSVAFFLFFCFFFFFCIGLDGHFVSVCLSLDFSDGVGSGYIAPEYQTEGVFSVKSDVYSFGVLVLEIVSGVRISSTDNIKGSPGLVAYVSDLFII